MPVHLHDVPGPTECGEYRRMTHLGLPRSARLPLYIHGPYAQILPTHSAVPGKKCGKTQA